MAENGGHLGVTAPLSLDPPSKRDLELNESLVTELKDNGSFESAEATQKRVDVLKKLGVLLTELVQLVGKKKGLPQEILKEAGGKVFTYGSYRLGVYGPGSDIDTLLIAPKHVTRDDFFTHMPDLIRKSTPPEELPELVPVREANVPIIKLEMSGISIDLIFSNLPLSSVPQSLELTDNALLRGLDATDLRCVNGTRVTDRILQLVPQSKMFRNALRAIKLWAQQRAIYGANYGFPGGVAYAMLVARICQLYPKAAASLIVSKFFFVVDRWNWPSPVILQAREVVPFMQEREWDTNVYKGDRFHLMPVITPAYPCMNSTASIGKSQKIVMHQELARAQEITTAIFNGKRQWKDLFERHTFFAQSYKHYICVIATGTTKDAYQAWGGLVGARLRRLISGIEASDADCVKLVHPYPKGIDREHECKNMEEREKVIDGSLDYQIATSEPLEESIDAKLAVAAEGDADAIAAESVDNVPEVKADTPHRVWNRRYYFGIELVKGKTNLDISIPIQEFKTICTDWDSYNPLFHAIRIKHVRDYDLPADVFVQGETRPTKKKKSKKPKESKPTAPVTNKRSISSAGLDENKDPAKRRQSGIVPSPESKQTKTNGVATPNGIAG